MTNNVKKDLDNETRKKGRIRKNECLAQEKKTAVKKRKIVDIITEV